ncbi:MAG: hypothetical protein J6H18_03265, partial [Lachnospiraceae bacterium]|nr:hypothetical protein [Lachnospiraceae bacterium]
MTNQTENTVPSVQESLPETETGGSAPSSSHHKRITILLLCLTVVLLAAGGFLMARFLRHPLKKSVEAGRQSIQDLEASPLGVFSDNLNRHGSFLLGANTSELSDLLADLLPLPLHLDAAAELEVFSQDGDLALRAGAQLKGRTLLDGLVLYREGKELAVSSEAFFGRTNYGLNLKTISRNLPNSVLNPSSGSPYALPERLYNYLISTDFREKDFRRLTEEGRGQFRKLVDRGADYLIQKARFQTGRSSITIGEEKINARTLTVMLDGETFCGLLKELIDFCRDNAGFRDYFLQLMGKLSLLFEDASPDNLKKSYLDFLQKLKEELPTLQESLKGAEFTALS